MVVSIVLLICSVVLGRQVTVRRWTMAVFVPPILWLAFRLVTQPQPMAAWYRAVDAGLVGLTALSVPLVLWVLARILAPEFFALPSRRLRVSAAAIVILVALIGFLVGWFNYHVVTCQDFVVAGDDTPANCRESTHDR